MHPAPSIVLFTVLTGLGLGQMAWLGLGLGPDGGLFRWLACALALALAGAGGLASTGHLGRRENAWRAFSQWRSSWLSRAACLMVAAMAAFGLYSAIWCLGGVRLWGLGLAAAALALDQEDDPGWANLEGAEITVFEDSAEGLASVAAARACLVDIGVSMQAILLGVTQSLPKRQALEAAQAEVFPSLAEALGAALA